MLMASLGRAKPKPEPEEQTESVDMREPPVQGSLF